MKSPFSYIALLLLVPAASLAQTAPSVPTKTSNPNDTAMIFQSPRPLIDNTITRNDFDNGAGFSGILNDYGFGVGLYYRREITQDLSAHLTFDVGTGKGSKEFGL